MIKCIIIDDEQHSIDLIKNFCSRIPYIELIGEFNDPLLAIPFIASHAIDIIFLDINMQSLSGIEFIKLYKPNNVIFITAYAEYALDSYEFGVIDYLLKPISFERFLAATQKVLNIKLKEIIGRSDGNQTQKEYFYVKTDREKYIKLNYKEIVYIEGLKNYISIHTTQDNIITLLNMKSIEDFLPKNTFIRVHKSYIINLDFFESIEGNKIRLSTVNDEISLGKTYRSTFLQKLEQNMLKK